MLRVRECIGVKLAHCVLSHPLAAAPVVQGFLMFDCNDRSKPCIAHQFTARRQQQTATGCTRRHCCGFLGFSAFVSGLSCSQSSMLVMVVEAMLASASWVRKALWGVISTCSCTPAQNVNS